MSSSSTFSSTDITSDTSPISDPLRQDSLPDASSVDPIPSESSQTLSQDEGDFDVEDDPDVVPKVVDPQEYLLCNLCYDLFYDPITTPCGHTYCRACLLSAFTQGNSRRNCPVCREGLSSYDPSSAPICHTVQSLLSNIWGDATEKRRLMCSVQRRPRVEQYGIFISDVPFYPLRPTTLFIFEPRYRILMNSIAATHRKFLIMSDLQFSRVISSQPPISCPEFHLTIRKRKSRSIWNHLASFFISSLFLERTASHFNLLKFEYNTCLTGPSDNIHSPSRRNLSMSQLLSMVYGSPRSTATNRAGASTSLAHRASHISSVASTGSSGLLSGLSTPAAPAATATSSTAAAANTSQRPLDDQSQSGGQQPPEPLKYPAFLVTLNSISSYIDGRLIVELCPKPVPVYVDSVTHDFHGLAIGNQSPRVVASPEPLASPSSPSSSSSLSPSSPSLSNQTGISAVQPDTTSTQYEPQPLHSTVSNSPSELPHTLPDSADIAESAESDADGTAYQRPHRATATTSTTSGSGNHVTTAFGEDQLSISPSNLEPSTTLFFSNYKQLTTLTPSGLPQPVSPSQQEEDDDGSNPLSSSPSSSSSPADSIDTSDDVLCNDLIVDLSEQELSSLISDFIFLYLEVFHTTRDHLQHKHGRKPDELHLLPYWVLNLVQGQSRVKELILASNNTKQRLQLSVLMLQNAILDKLYDRVRYTAAVLFLFLAILLYKLLSSGPSSA